MSSQTGLQGSGNRFEAGFGLLVVRVAEDRCFSKGSSSRVAAAAAVIKFVFFCLLALVFDFSVWHLSRLLADAAMSNFGRFAVDLERFVARSKASVSSTFLTGVSVNISQCRFRRLFFFCCLGPAFGNGRIVSGVNEVASSGTSGSSPTGDDGMPTFPVFSATVKFHEHDIDNQVKYLITIIVIEIKKYY